MRIKVNFVGTEELVPINNNHLLTSYIHKCLGVNNKYHDTVNNYSISQISGGKMNSDKETLNYKNGAFFVVSSLDLEFINTLMIGIMTNKEGIGYGLFFNNFDTIQEKFVDGWNNFATLSPFLMDDKEKSLNNDGKRVFLTMRDENFVENVENYLKTKISAIDEKLDISNFKINIDVNHTSHKVKTIMMKKKKKDGTMINVKNVANQCHISIFTNKKVAELLYNIGIGKSTGCGFGSIYKTENRELYYV